MSVFYKFASSTEVGTVVFDGVHISVGDLKHAIMEQKKLGRGTDFDLIVTNAQTNEEYKKNDVLIPKNTSLVVKRVPAANGAPVKKFWDPNANKMPTISASFAAAVLPPQVSTAEPVSGSSVFAGSDLTKIGGSEEDKIKHMMSQSTSQYDPSRYVKYKGAHLLTPAPSSHKCYRCFNYGHYVQNCPLVAAEVKKATGIPRSFMVKVDDPKTPGAMLAPDGSLAVHRVDYSTYKDKQQGRMDTPPPSTRPQVPDDLRCKVCKDLIREAVTSPCCGENFCDECLRTALVDSENSECPECHQVDVSPDNIIPNRFIRKRVVKFEKETDYWEVAAREREAAAVAPPAAPAPAAADTPPSPAAPEAPAAVAPAPAVEVGRPAADALPTPLPPLQESREASPVVQSQPRSPSPSPSPPPPPPPQRSPPPAPSQAGRQERTERERTSTPPAGGSPPPLAPPPARRQPVRAARSPPPPPRHSSRSPRSGSPAGRSGRSPHSAERRPPLAPRAADLSQPPPGYGAPLQLPTITSYTSAAPSLVTTLAASLPSGPVDDPLAEFNRLMRQKDLRDGRVKRRSFSPRSRSRSPRSRSRSPMKRRSSRSPPPRRRSPSRSPRPRSRSPRRYSRSPRRSSRSPPPPPPPPRRRRSISYSRSPSPRKVRLSPAGRRPPSPGDGYGRRGEPSPPPGYGREPLPPAADQYGRYRGGDYYGVPPAGPQLPRDYPVRSEYPPREYPAQRPLPAAADYYQPPPIGGGGGRGGPAGGRGRYAQQPAAPPRPLMGSYESASAAWQDGFSRYGQEYGAAGEYQKYPGGYPAPQHGQYGIYRAEESRRLNGRYPSDYDEFGGGAPGSKPPPPQGYRRYEMERGRFEAEPGPLPPPLLGRRPRGGGGEPSLLQRYREEDRQRREKERLGRERDLRTQLGDPSRSRRSAEERRVASRERSSRGREGQERSSHARDERGHPGRASEDASGHERHAESKEIKRKHDKHERIEKHDKKEKIKKKHKKEKEEAEEPKKKKKEKTKKKKVKAPVSSEADVEPSSQEPNSAPQPVVGGDSLEQRPASPAGGEPSAPGAVGGQPPRTVTPPLTPPEPAGSPPPEQPAAAAEQPVPSRWEQEEASPARAGTTISAELSAEHRSVVNKETLQRAEQAVRANRRRVYIEPPSPERPAEPGLQITVRRDAERRPAPLRSTVERPRSRSQDRQRRPRVPDRRADERRERERREREEMERREREREDRRRREELEAEREKRRRKERAREKKRRDSQSEGREHRRKHKKRRSVSESSSSEEEEEEEREVKPRKKKAKSPAPAASDERTSARPALDRTKSFIDEQHFEPDFEPDDGDEAAKKEEPPAPAAEVKRAEKPKKRAKKPVESSDESDSVSSSEESESSDQTAKRKRRKKKRRRDSTDSSGSEVEKRKKKRGHKKREEKKRKDKKKKRSRK